MRHGAHHDSARSVTVWHSKVHPHLQWHGHAGPTVPKPRQLAQKPFQSRPVPLHVSHGGARWVLTLAAVRPRAIKATNPPQCASICFVSRLVSARRVASLTHSIAGAFPPGLLASRGATLRDDASNPFPFVASNPHVAGKWIICR